jgi:hypothetical protein
LGTGQKFFFFGPSNVARGFPGPAPQGDGNGYRPTRQTRGLYKATRFTTPADSTPMLKAMNCRPAGDSEAAITEVSPPPVTISGPPAMSPASPITKLRWVAIELGYAEGQNLAVERQFRIGSASWLLNWSGASPISLSRSARRRHCRQSKRQAQSPLGGSTS